MSQVNPEPGALLVQSPAIPAIPREPFLHFYLDSETDALLPLQRSVEVLNISRKEIVPIFFMPAWVTGIYNLKGEILWVVDLAYLLGLTSQVQQDYTRFDLTILVLQASPQHSTPSRDRNQMLGCLINRLESIEYCDLTTIQPPSTVPVSKLSAFLQGYWSKTPDEPIAILDTEAIFQYLSQIDYAEI